MELLITQNHLPLKKLWGFCNSYLVVKKYYLDFVDDLLAKYVEQPVMDQMTMRYLSYGKCRRILVAYEQLGQSCEN